MMSRFPALSIAVASRLGRASRSITKRAAVVSVLGAIGTLVWAGCGSGDDDRYYCDDVSCYQCDAYGCSSVSAPPKTPCTGASSCAAGSVCTSDGCTTTCSDGAPCAKGEVCKDGLCSAPAVDPGPTKDCTTKSDCGDGKTCVASTCQACGGAAGPCPCTAATDCASGQACVGGSCSAPSDACKFSSECDSGKVCADGQCLTSCETAPCATGFTCDKTVCKPTPTPTCTSDQECSGDTPHCAAGTCVKSCTADTECGAGNFCNQGACEIDTRPHPNCTDDTQCGGTAETPKKCMGGFCKYTCSATGDTGDQYCRTIDNRIGYCGKDLVCRSSTEANAQCTVSTDCTGGAICVDNACK